MKLTMQFTPTRILRPSLGFFIPHYAIENPCLADQAGITSINHCEIDTSF